MRRIADANGALLEGYVHNALGQRLFKTEPQYPPAAGDEADPAFFTCLLAEIGSGGAQSTGTSLYFYLPTPSGPMPIAAITNGTGYAVHTDHLNTPRRLTLANKTVAWQWAFSAFGDAQPTAAKNRFVDLTTSASLGGTNIADVAFNLRYPGQYFDKESGLHYNYFRSYDPRTGRYTQSDPIDLSGGWNRFSYVKGNPLSATDPLGLFTSDQHFAMTLEALWSCGFSASDLRKLARASAAADWTPSWRESQAIENAPWHSMTSTSVNGDPSALTERFIREQMAIGTTESIGRAVHAAQDSTAGGHDGSQRYTGQFDLRHLLSDLFPSKAERQKAIEKTRALFEKCGCKR